MVKYPALNPSATLLLLDMLLCIMRDVIFFLKLWLSNLIQHTEQGWTEELQRGYKPLHGSNKASSFWVKPWEPWGAGGCAGGLKLLIAFACSFLPTRVTGRGDAKAPAVLATSAICICLLARKIHCKDEWGCVILGPCQCEHLKDL